jgi:hypothetical protein
MSIDGAAAIRTRSSCPRHGELRGVQHRREQLGHLQRPTPGQQPQHALARGQSIPARERLLIAVGGRVVEQRVADPAARHARLPIDVDLKTKEEQHEVDSRRDRRETSGAPRPDLGTHVIHDGNAEPLARAILRLNRGSR